MDRWSSLGATERAYYYYDRIYRHLLELEEVYVVDYDGFIADPATEFRRLAEWLDAE